MRKEPRLHFTDEKRADPALEKPIRKADRAAVKADKAQAKIPKKQVRQKTVDPETGKVTTTAGTARTVSDPTFSAAKIAPYEATVTTFVDRNLSRLTPVAYEEKIRSIAMRSLRRAVAKLIYNGDGQGTPDMYGIKTAKDTAGTALFKTVNVSSIEAGFLDSIVFAYGSDEEVGGNARLFLTKADLAAIGALRNADDNRVYEIVPDAFWTAASSSPIPSVPH